MVDAMIIYARSSSNDAEGKRDSQMHQTTNGTSG